MAITAQPYNFCNINEIDLTTLPPIFKTPVKELVPKPSDLLSILVQALEEPEKPVRIAMGTFGESSNDREESKGGYRCYGCAATLVVMKLYPEAVVDHDARWAKYENDIDGMEYKHGNDLTKTQNGSEFSELEHFEYVIDQLRACHYENLQDYYAPEFDVPAPEEDLVAIQDSSFDTDDDGVQTLRPNYLLPLIAYRDQLLEARM